MAATVTVDSATKDANGVVRFRFGNDELEFNSVAGAIDAMRNRFNRQDLMMIAIARALTIQPALNNPSAFNGHSVTVDLTQANWGTST